MTKQAAKTEVRPKPISLPELYIGVALACHTSWVSMSFKSMNFYANYTHSESLLDSTYLISIVAVSLTLALIGVFHQHSGLLLTKAWVKIATPLAMSASTLLMPLSGMGAEVGTVSLYASGLLSGISSGVLLMYIGMALSRFKTRGAVLSAATGHILSTLLFALFLLFSPFEASILAASMPIVVSLLLYLGMEHIDVSDSGEIVPLARQEPLPDEFEAHDLRHLTWRLGWCSVLVGFANEAVRTIYIQMGIVTEGAQAYATLTAFVAFVVSGGAIVIALALLNTKTFMMPKYCYRALVSFLFIGVILVPLPLIYPEVAVYLPYSINTASYQCFSMMMWVIVAGICRRYSSMRVRTFAFIRSAWALGPLLGLLVGRAVIHQPALSIQTVFPIMIFASFALLLVINVAFTETDLMNAMNVIPTERRRRFVEKCQKVIEKYCLSEREGEIMTMFAKGRNLAYIQVQLSLSKSTVSTHRQHIYQKLGIHSQQELLDLIQDAK